MCVFVHAFVGVVRDSLCGDVCFGCVLCLFVSHCFESVLIVVDCVMLYGFLFFFGGGSCSMFACVPCVCVFRL